MPRNGSGGYIPPAGQPVVSGTAISSGVFNVLVSDIGAELTKSICTDGQTPMTAALQMGNNRVSNLAAATVGSDAVRFDQVTGAYLPLAGGTLTGSLTLSNNTGIYLKDAGNTVRQLFNFDTASALNWTIPGGTTWNLYNQAGSTLLQKIDNVGTMSLTGNVQLNNGLAFSSKDSGGTVRQLLYMAGDTVIQRIAGGTTLAWYNQSGSTAVATLDNAGNYSAVTVTQTSDERKKKLWQRLPHDFVAQLAGIRKSGLFTWRKGGGLGVGVGAQSLERILPVAVHTDERGAKTVNYGAAAMVSVVELARELVAVKKRLAALEAK